MTTARYTIWSALPKDGPGLSLEAISRKTGIVNRETVRISLKSLFDHKKATRHGEKGAYTYTKRVGSECQPTKAATLSSQGIKPRSHHGHAGAAVDKFDKGACMDLWTAWGM